MSQQVPAASVVNADYLAVISNALTAVKAVFLKKLKVNVVELQPLPFVDRDTPGLPVKAPGFVARFDEDVYRTHRQLSMCWQVRRNSRARRAARPRTITGVGAGNLVALAAAGGMPTVAGLVAVVVGLGAAVAAAPVQHGIVAGVAMPNTCGAVCAWRVCTRRTKLYCRQAPHA